MVQKIPSNLPDLADFRKELLEFNHEEPEMPEEKVETPKRSIARKLVDQVLTKNLRKAMRQDSAKKSCSKDKLVERSKRANNS